MPKQYTKIMLETRTPRKDGKFPVKLRLTINRKSRYYALDHNLTVNEFKKVFDPDTTSRKLKKIRSYLIDEEERANELLETMKTPDFKLFKNLYTLKSPGGNVVKCYDAKIAECIKEGRYGTADTYKFALQSLKSVSNVGNLNFSDITVTWLKNYVSKMKGGTKPRTTTTISMYLRTLRALYNDAINKRIVNSLNYPFGDPKRGLFRIPAHDKNKRPLERDEMQKIINYSGNPVNEMYRDFFILSYSLFGLNPMDMLSLKWSNLDGDILTVVRKKTATTNTRETEIELFVNERARKIIQKYGDKKSNYIFNVFLEKDDPETRRRKIRNFNRAINQAMKSIAKSEGIKKNISCMHARHSAASHANERKVSLPDISAALGHSNIKITNDYLSSLNAGKRHVTESLET